MKEAKLLLFRVFLEIEEPFLPFLEKILLSLSTLCSIPAGFGGEKQMEGEGEESRFLVLIPALFSAFFFGGGGGYSKL